MSQRRLVACLCAAALPTLLSSCVTIDSARSGPAECTFQPEGEEVFVDCSDGSHFQAPSRGGVASGFDRRGRDLDATVTLTDGRYSIFVY